MRTGTRSGLWTEKQQDRKKNIGQEKGIVISGGAFSMNTEQNGVDKRPRSCLCNRKEETVDIAYSGVAGRGAARFHDRFTESSVP